MKGYQAWILIGIVAAIAGMYIYQNSQKTETAPVTPATTA